MIQQQKQGYFIAIKWYPD